MPDPLLADLTPRETDVRRLITRGNSNAETAESSISATDQHDSEAVRRVATVYARASAPLVFRTREQIAGLFTGFELLSPGVVPLPEWRPEPRPYPPGEVWGLAGVGRLAGLSAVADWNTASAGRLR